MENGFHGVGVSARASELLTLIVVPEFISRFLSVKLLSFLSLLATV